MFMSSIIPSHRLRLQVFTGLFRRALHTMEFDYDYAVIGGGSGGLASAKAAAALGAKVCIFDYVKPSSQGSKWGLGGTCVNVGCVPKKIYHHASTVARYMSWEAPYFGITNFSKPDLTYHEQDPLPINTKWEELAQNIQNYIRQLNFSYRNGLRTAGVTYINALAKVTAPNEISYQLKDEGKSIKAKHIVVAVGGRPSIPRDIPGAAEYCITSDDIFSLRRSPGKTLVIGGSYIALECAGFLTGLGFDVTVAVRSILLRGFDRQCAEKVGVYMKETGTRFLNEYLVKSVKKEEQGLVVELHPTSDPSNVHTEVFDTVMYATGRNPDTRALGLDSVPVKLTKDGFIICNQFSQSSVESIYAIGDVVEGFPELTPAAIKAGEILARRLFANSTEVMSIENIPTTVFTPMEYACVGYSEDQAIEKFGEDNLEVYLSEFASLEESSTHRPKHASCRTSPEDTSMTPPCLSKLICLKTENEKVIGVHFVGPHAGELMQGMAIAVRAGVSKKDFDSCVGIHPTDAESFVQLSITRRSGENWVASGGCGGGKCG